MAMLQQRARMGHHLRSTAETCVSYWHSNLRPPCRREDKIAWTRSDSAAVRRHKEDRMKPENVSARRMVIWLQDVHQITPWKSRRAASHDG
eukprot:1887572-Prymnesium_polylepis.1